MHKPGTVLELTGCTQGFIKFIGIYDLSNMIHWKTWSLLWKSCCFTRKITFGILTAFEGEDSRLRCLRRTSTNFETSLYHMSGWGETRFKKGSKDSILSCIMDHRCRTPELVPENSRNLCKMVEKRGGGEEMELKGTLK